MVTTMAEHSPAYEAFLASMNIGLSEWRDGIGYDLGALPKITRAGRTELGVLMGERLKTTPDWRGVEALSAIGTPAALAILRAARQHDHPAARMPIAGN